MTADTHPPRMGADTEAFPRTAPAPPEAFERCLSCGANAMRAFCGECGERRRSPSDYAFRRFLAHAVQVATSVDSTIARSAAALFVWPGHLTAEHFVGRRRLYLDPLQLFLICNLVFFAVGSLSAGGVFTTRLSDQLLHHPYSDLLRTLEAQPGVTFEALLNDSAAFRAYAERYDALTNTLARSLVVLFVPLVAAVTFVLYGRSARFFAQHLIFALHFLSYFLLMICALMIAQVGVKWGLGQQGIRFEWQVWDAVLGLSILFFALIYLAEAGSRAFGESLPWTIAKAALIGVALLPMMWVYRLILFFATRAAV